MPAALSAAGKSYFYPRPPRGGRPALIGGKLTLKKFLSTPSARRATQSGRPERPSRPFLSTPSARRATSCSPALAAHFSFLSTPSARRATLLTNTLPDNTGYFYPRPPRGGRPPQPTNHFIIIGFLSTPSARRATCSVTTTKTVSRFLSTPSARRATRAGAPTPQPARDFYPRPPRGGRRKILRPLCSAKRFLSTPSARRATHRRPQAAADRPYFYPRPPRGGRRRTRQKLLLCSYFYPRPPRGGRRRSLAKVAILRVISIHALREEGDVADYRQGFSHF